MLTNLSKAPFPWFGGKRKAAPVVWEALGDCPHYVEPFAGSLAVLLERPHTANRPYYSETVNDLDGFVVNAWRSIQLHPDATAEAASWPVSEACLHARHVAVLRWRQEREVERLMGDPDYCDPKIAGWWLWGQSSWIGSGWASGNGPWWPDETGRLVKHGRGGVSRQLPHIGDNGRGVNHAGLREEGVGEPDYHPVTMPELRRWFAYLSARLRHVRILNGDWKRAVTTGAILTLPVRQGNGPCGVFLDPPYADTAKRCDDLYAHDSLDVAHAVREWCLERGDDERYRIVLAGFEGEHKGLVEAGWREVEWFASGFLTGGMGNVSRSGAHQQNRERLWLSPHCLGSAEDVQGDLFAGLSA